jgi:TnpA family transposase
LLYQEPDLRIEEHYTGTAGFTDHVFALCHLTGFCFAPRIRDFADKRLYVSNPDREYAALAPLVGGTLHLKLVTAQWEEVLRLATSIRHGTVTASLIIRKLASYPPQNCLHAALREVGRMECTLFMREWMQDPELRKSVQLGLNKGEARNALARAVFFNRQGELRDRTFENQRYRASGLNLVGPRDHIVEHDVSRARCQGTEATWHRLSRRATCSRLSDRLGPRQPDRGLHLAK